jgi:hypothetical protein
MPQRDALAMTRLTCLRSSSAFAAENFFLRKQLARYPERHVKPRRATNIARIARLRPAR